MKKIVVAAIALCAFVQTALAQDCPGQLLINGDFEEPNTMLVPTDHKDQYANNRWGWYLSDKVPGWYTTRPDGLPCARTDWMQKKMYIEIARGALATPAVNKQYAELLPNATGNYCQDVQLQQGARYRLTYFYGRLMTKTEGKDRGTHGTGQMTAFDTAVDVAIRPSSYQPSATGAPWPKDTQGYNKIDNADTLEDWSRSSRQWTKHQVEFTAPADRVTLAFINAKRPKVCGSCGSLLDGVCLQRI
ncbi:hypothetical protein OEZ85_000746 [Tetradesmus obliquus]|uniref:Uncharacterized protein n=1 Tax=Tetradesmus obliquus TaxID=3088 RepID=A0ABY8UJL5_TETOB|nr:hypothetical protein OEZ85_000746 [Tetradesmus obliquus]